MGNITDYNLIQMNFPNGKTKEAVTENEDGSYTIFIDKNISDENKKKHFIHALKHIYNDDLCNKDYSANEIESMTHRISI